MSALYTAVIRYKSGEVVVDLAGGFQEIFWVLEQLIHDATWYSFDIARKEEEEKEK